MAGGRPTKYTHEIVKKAKEYVHNYEDYGHAFPSIVGLSLVLGIDRSTVADWGRQEEKPEFSRILEEIDSTQQLVAWNKGLNGEYNANLVKLLLGKHGFSDKQTLEGNPDKPISVNRIEIIAPEKKDD